MVYTTHFCEDFGDGFCSWVNPTLPGAQMDEVLRVPASMMAGILQGGIRFSLLGFKFFFWEPCSWQICDVIAKKLHPLELF